MSIAREGWPFVLTAFFAAGIAVAAARIGWYSTLLGIIGLAAFGIGVLFLWFFRDPWRSLLQEAAAAVAPADGRVIEANRLPDGRWHMAIFLSLFNVHVNRVPVSGRIKSVSRRRGSYLPAFSARAAERNARVDVVCEANGGDVAWRQISGLLARRISCRLQPGDEVKRGDRFGLIYFGSRMDIFYPANVELIGQVGDRVLAGETLIARFRIETGN